LLTIPPQHLIPPPFSSCCLVLPHFLPDFRISRFGHLHSFKLYHSLQNLWFFLN
jgi:hypothetical protein